MAINKVIVAGNLTRDAELRQTKGGSFVLTMGIAVNDRRKNGNGEWEDYPNFFDANIIGSRAEKLAPYLTKGKKVAIEGKLHYSAWEKDGQKRSKVDITVDNIEFMGGSDNRADNPVANVIQDNWKGARVTETDDSFQQYSTADIPF